MELIIILLLRMKRKEPLLEIVRKEKDFNLLAFLTPKDTLNLSLCSKKLYSQLAATLQSLKLDLQIQQPKSKTKKNKLNKVKQEIQPGFAQTEVEIQKVPIFKFSKINGESAYKNWKKVDQIDIQNSYLAKKIQSKTVIFYQNEITKQLIFINRSIVDPTLNYNKGGFGQRFINNDLYQHMFAQGQFNQQDFISTEALLKRQKENLEKINWKKQEQKKNSEISYENELQKAMKMKKFAIILCFGGSFSFGIFQNGKCIVHRSDKKYVVRQKAGQRQFNKDKNSGSQIQSIGSQIRRDQQKKHVINVGQILKEHHRDLKECEIILLQAPGLNRLFVINQNENLEGMQDILRSVCLTAKKANFTQIEALFDVISQVSIVRIANQESKTKGKTNKRK